MRVAGDLTSPAADNLGSVPNTHLAHLRLVSQRIIASDAATPVDAVRSMLAVQAQDFAASRWAVGLRAPGSTVADVEAAFAAGTIVRSWPMRGTLHVTAAEDLPWILALTSARTVASAAKRHSDLGLDDPAFAQARDVAERYLAGGHALPREQLLALFEQHGIEVSGQRGYHLLWRLAHDGAICLGPLQGARQTIVLLDEWVKTPIRFEREQALGELARRYFEGHGPATERDLAWWSKLTLKDIRAGIAVARSQLETLVVDDTTYFMAAGAEARFEASRKAAVRSLALLPGFDEYLLGYADRSAVLASEYSQRIAPGGNGIFAATVVFDGQVVGTWRRGAEKAPAIQLQPFTELSATATKGLARASAAYARFVGAPFVPPVVAPAG